MKQEQINDIKDVMALLLGRIFTDATECLQVTNELADEVVEDIEETADKDFNDSDIRIALARVLQKRIGINN